MRGTIYMIKNQAKKSNIYILIFVTLILFVALFLRIYNLEKFSLWADEPYHLFVSQSILEDGSLKLPSGNEYGRAKLFSYITALSTYIFGMNEFGLRLPTALFGFLSLLIFFFFTRKLLNNSLAIVSLILLTFLPLEIGWARVTRFYTLFQFFSIIVWYSFYIGFIRKNNTFEKYESFKISNFINVVKNWKINWLFLLLFFVVFLLAVSVQIIGALLLIPIFTFIVLYGFYLLLKVDLKNFFVSKYFIAATSSAFLIVIAYLFLPQISDLMNEGLTYIPAFAKYQVGLDRMQFIKFIMSKDIFPIGAFFVIGTLQSVLRMNKIILYSALFFIIPMFLFTFVFSYRLIHYIYNVIPFFVLVAGYGVVNVVIMERENFKRVKNIIYQWLSKYTKKTSIFVILMFTLLFVFSPFFIEGLSIPFRKPGEFNGAVKFVEWKEGVEFLKDNAENSDVILTTLPLAIKHYFGRADYNLNLNDVAVARLNGTMDSQNRYYDFYTGIYFIENSIQLDQLKKDRSSGYIIIDTFRLVTSQYVSKDLARHIEENLELVYLTPYQTVRVYKWGQ